MKKTAGIAMVLIIIVLVLGCRDAQPSTYTTNGVDTSAPTQTTETATQGTIHTDPTAQTTEVTGSGGGEETDATAGTVHIQEGVTDWEDPTVETTQKDEPGRTETEPTQPPEPSQPVQPTESSEPNQTTESTQPVQTTEPAGPELLTFEQYLALTDEEKYSYYKAFPTEEAFHEWEMAAEEAYEEGKNTATGDAIIVIPGN